MLHLTNFFSFSDIITSVAIEIKKFEEKRENFYVKLLFINKKQNKLSCFLKMPKSTLITEQMCVLTVKSFCVILNQRWQGTGTWSVEGKKSFYKSPILLELKYKNITLKQLLAWSRSKMTEASPTRDLTIDIIIIIIIISGQQHKIYSLFITILQETSYPTGTFFTAQTRLFGFPLLILCWSRLSNSKNIYLW